MNELKITLVGDSGTGKTSILRVFDGYSYEDICEVKKCDTISKYMVVNNASYMLELRDTVGLEKFQFERTNLYKDTDLFFICFAENNPISLKNVLVKWYSEIKKLKPRTPIYLICTKYDVKSKLTLSQEITDVKKKIRATQLIFCSAKTGLNIRDMFEQAIMDTFDVTPKSPKSPTTIIPKFFLRSNSAY